jgi:Fur family transcriptional regulator, zinc uptake regulator
MPQHGPNETAVLEVLRTERKPLSAYDLLDLLRGTRLRAAVQVYRALEKLSQAGLVHRVESLNAFVVCDCAHDKSTPGFMLCTCCGDVEEFDAGKTMSAVKPKLKQFKIQHPSLELKGLCANCQQDDHTHGVGQARPTR